MITWRLLGVALPDDSGVGMAGVTVNTFVDTMTGADTSFTIPFTDPLAAVGHPRCERLLRPLRWTAELRSPSPYSTPTASMMFSRAARRAGGSEPSRLIASAPTVKTSAIGLGRKATVKFIMSPLTRL